MKRYLVEYKMHSAGEVKTMSVHAKNKEEAFERATFDLIPLVELEHPFSSWVASRIYENGRVQRFNTFEGKPY